MDRLYDFAFQHLWISQLAGFVAGFIVLGESVPLGLATLAIGAVSVYVSISRGPWSEMSNGQRAAVVPGMLVGLVTVMFALMLLHAFIIAVKEEFN